MKYINLYTASPISNTILIFFLFLMTNEDIYAQNAQLVNLKNGFHKALDTTTKNTNLRFGLAFGPQDRRLFDFPDRKFVLENEKSETDFEFNLALQKRIIKTRFLDFDAGLGITSTNTTFSRPVNQSELGNNNTVLIYLKRYTVNKLCPIVTGRLYPMGKRNRLFFSFEVVSGFDFRKSVKHGPHLRDSKWGFHFNSLELYPGLGVRIGKRTMLSFAYRNFYVYRLDKVIFNYLLFVEREPEFLKTKYDHYTLKKYCVSVGYALQEKKAEKIKVVE